jgi:2-amino-4-hydroxy-6-hydroxymethyldihydropteridine diphosphokinase
MGLEPELLLHTLLRIEEAHGRNRREKWGPRTMDLDLLLVGDRWVQTPGLTLPHPHLHERPFVLWPLLDAWPDAWHPTLGPLLVHATQSGTRGVRAITTDDTW